jgi:ABC-type uncharacterized transport system substrate-binding protein
MNIGKLLKGAVKVVKENPEVALAVLGIAAPKVAKKVVVLAPIVAAAIKKPAAE